MPAGRYHLGRLWLEVISGSPELRFAQGSEYSKALRTSFGSMDSGKDGDNTLKYTEYPSKLGNAVQGSPGDWTDADGVGRPESQSAAAADRPEGDAIQFGVAVIRGRSGAAAGLRVSTSQNGTLRIRVFNVSGRLVRTLVDTREIAAGTHKFQLQEGQNPGVRIAAGVYFFRVEAKEGTLTGRLVVPR